MEKPDLQQEDPELYAILKKEETKQQEKITLIPSENFASKAIQEAVGSVFMNKYSEGYPGKRYYEGNYFIDELETLTIERVKQAFHLPNDWAVNVQALSGSAANLAVYLGLLETGDTVMGMYLPDGGHLSHGWSYEPEEIQDPNNLVYTGGSRKVNITSRFWHVVQYKTNPNTQQFDYAEIEKIAQKHKPKLLITGGTAYPREIEYQKMSAIAKGVGAYYLADIAHEAGLVAAGGNQSPVGIADVVTLTTHKTLRCNRGAIILSKKECMKKIDRAIFPGLQGGPHNHSIAGIAVGLREAMTPAFRTYAEQIVQNAREIAAALFTYDFHIISGGTDKHLVLIDLTNKQVFGKKYARALDYAGIIANMNTMPQETRSPADPSALRIGTPSVTTRGMKEKEMTTIAEWMNRVMDITQPWNALDFESFETHMRQSEKIQKIAEEVKTLCKIYPFDI